MTTVADLLRVPPGRPFRLADVDPSATPGTDLDKAGAKAETAALTAELAELQERLWARSRHGDERRVLLVLQGRDAAGKGGAVKKVVGEVDPAGVRVTGFGRPTEEERAHDFLWRVERALPGPGTIGVFDRSHYEDVLAVRVRGLAPREVWEPRFDRINAWERELVDRGVLLVKAVLHVSREEQLARLLKRLDRPDKHWKVDPGDVDDRALWEEYGQAYDDVLTRTSTEHAPWYVVPTDRKWYRDWALAHLLLDVLRAQDLPWPQRPDLDLDGLRRALQGDSAGGG